MKRVLRGAVRAYQLGVSPLLAPRCRFLPSCSDYALQAIERHGAAAGSVLALRRLLRCHPWCEGGIDEVPPLLPRRGGVRNAVAPSSNPFLPDGAAAGRMREPESDR